MPLSELLAEHEPAERRGDRQRIHRHAPDDLSSAHCTGVIPAITGINVDKKDPTVTVTTPAPGTRAYIINQVVNANYGCADGGSGVDDCIGTVPSGAAVNTATVGTHAFDVMGQTMWATW